MPFKTIGAFGIGDFILAMYFKMVFVKQFFNLSYAVIVEVNT